jgi:hypothetical protein
MLWANTMKPASRRRRWVCSNSTVLEAAAGQGDGVEARALGEGARHRDHGDRKSPVEPCGDH